MKTHCGSLQKRRTSRGSILVMSVFFLIILFITASAFITLLPVESHAARRSAETTQGGMVADAGVGEALTWLRFQLSPPTGPAKEPMSSGVYPSSANRTRAIGKGWQYQWRLIPDSETAPNGSNPIRGYTIESTAYLNGKAKTKATAEVIQSSLLHYAELYDTWPTNLVKGVRTNSAPLGGPVHSNDAINLWIQEGNAFWTHAGLPPFSHGLTTSGVKSGSQDGFGYYEGNYSGSDATKVPYNAGGPITSRYARIAAGGRDAMRSGVGEIPLPENSFNIRDAAWGFDATAPLPTAAGVHINVVEGKAQGVYIQGDVEEMQLGFGGSQPAGGSTVSYGNNSWVKIEIPTPGQRSIDANQNVTVVTVADDPVVLPAGSFLNGTTTGSPTTITPGNTLVRRANGRFESYNGDLNGVVYANGTIRNLWGVNKGRRTIAVSGDSANSISNDIIIGGREPDTGTDAQQNAATSMLSTAVGQKGLIQFGATDVDGDGILDPPTTANHTLGLMATDIWVSRRLKNNDRWDTSHPENNPLYIYASVLGGLANGGGSYKVQDYESGGGGWAYKFGSRIMVDAGAWGTTSGHGLVKGTTFFDEPASLQPPPYFPAQPTFVLKTYEEVPLTVGEL